MTTNNNTTRVAVVVPTHQRARILAGTLASVAGQTRRPDVVVVVDDAADAPTRELVDNVWRLHRLETVYLGNETGCGASSSRNLGAASVSCDVIAFLDDDDVWEPTYLAEAIDRMTVTGADVVATWLGERRGSRIVPLRSVREQLSALDVVAVNPGVGGSNVVVTRAAHVAIAGFDEDLPVSNDKDYFVRLLRSGARYAVVERRLVHVGHDAGGRLTDTDQRRLDGMRRYYRKHVAYCGRAQQRELQRQIRRAEVRVRRDEEPRRWMQHLLTTRLVVLARPRKLPTAIRVRQLLVPPRAVERS